MVCVSFVSFWLLFPFPGKTQDSELQTHLLPDGSQLSMKMASLSQRGGTGVDCTIMSCSLWYDYATDYNDDATDDDGVDDVISLWFMFNPHVFLCSLLSGESGVQPYPEHH